MRSPVCIRVFYLEQNSGTDWEVEVQAGSKFRGGLAEFFGSAFPLKKKNLIAFFMASNRSKKKINLGLCADLA